MQWLLHEAAHYPIARYCYCYCYMVQDLPEHPVGIPQMHLVLKNYVGS